MVQRVRIFLLVEAVGFGLAALIHSGNLISVYEHSQASITEGVIAAVLFGGLILTSILQK